MGYYSDFRYEINHTICERKGLENVEKYFSNLKDEIYGFYEVKFKTIPCNDNKNNIIIKDIVLDDFTAKFYDDILFAEKLSKIVLSGSVSLYFYGEDGSQWGYNIRNHHVEEYDAWFLTQEESEYIKEYRRIRGKEEMKMSA